MRGSTLGALGCALLLGACGSDVRSPPGAGSGGSSTHVAAPPDELEVEPASATFTVELVKQVVAARESSFTTLVGKAYEAPPPSAVAWELVTSQGDCELHRPRAPYCSPACESGSVCASDAACVPYPATRDWGSFQVRGLGDSDFVLRRTAGVYQVPAEVRLPNPPCLEGATFEVASSELALRGHCIAPLEVQTPEPVTLTPGEPVVLRWTAAASPERSHVVATLDVSHHGGSKGKLTCVAPDAGHLSIPAGLLAELVALGTAGFPALELARVSRTSSEVDGRRIALKSSSSVVRALEIPGVSSCTSDDDCPAGQACGADMSCQRD